MLQGLEKLQTLMPWVEGSHRNRFMFAYYSAAIICYGSKEAYRLAKEINIPQTRISEIIHGHRSITADTAIRFSKFFGTTAEFWLNLQNLYDLEEEEKNHAPEFETIKMYAYA